MKHPSTYVEVTHYPAPPIPNAQPLADDVDDAHVLDNHDGEHFGLSRFGQWVEMMYIYPVYISMHCFPKGLITSIYVAA